MNLEVRCPQCGQAHAAPPHMAGKKVRCKRCSVGIRIPGDPAPIAASAAPPTADRRRPDTAPAPAPTEFDPYDLADAAPDGRDAASADGLGADAFLPPRAGLGPEPPARADTTKKKRRKKKGGSAAERFELLQTIGLLVAFVALVGLAGLGLFVPAARSATIMLTLVAGIILAAVGSIWSAWIPFQESARCGIMYLVVPFYAGYYFRTRFDEMFKPWLVGLVGCGMVYMTTLGPLGHPAPIGPDAIDAEDYDEFEEAGVFDDAEADDFGPGIPDF